MELFIIKYLRKQNTEHRKQLCLVSWVLRPNNKIMKKILLSLSVLFILTACGGPKLPDPDMKLPTEPPNPELMEPTSSPE